MRAFLDRHTWVTYLVVGLFLLATSGTALSRMTCLEGGHSVLSLGMATDCCPEGEAPGDLPTYEPYCCELATVQGDRDDYLPHEVLQLAVAEVTSVCCVQLVMAPALVPHVSWLGTRPPPLSAPDRLAVLSVQRV